MQKITPFLWFDDKAEEAANHYVSTFPNSRIVRVDRYGAESARASGRPVGSVMTVAFELEGQAFVALNGGPQFQFSGAISFVVDYLTQEEIDAVWSGLAAGGRELQCGWLTDRFGVTWQVVPSDLDSLLLDSDPLKAGRTWQAMMQMTKLDVAALRRAHSGN